MLLFNRCLSSSWLLVLLIIMEFIQHVNQLLFFSFKLFVIQVICQFCTLCRQEIVTHRDEMRLDLRVWMFARFSYEIMVFLYQIFLSEQLSQFLSTYCLEHSAGISESSICEKHQIIKSHKALIFVQWRLDYDLPGVHLESDCHSKKSALNILDSSSLNSHSWSELCIKVIRFFISHGVFSICFGFLKLRIVKLFLGEFNLCCKLKVCWHVIKINWHLSFGFLHVLNLYLSRSNQMLRDKMAHEVSFTHYAVFCLDAVHMLWLYGGYLL